MRIRRPVRFRETEGHMRLLSAGSSPNGIQGLLQYFDLVEGCLNMIAAYETQGNFTYDWILRTRVDGYWTGPLDLKAFKTDSYIVPEGSRYGGLNDRLGIGNRSISDVALSRLSLLPNLASAGFNRQYKYPPSGDIAPVASIASPGPLSGAKCRPCAPHCKGECIEKLGPEKWLGWTEWRNGSLELCDGSQPWQEGWEDFFDKVAGKVTADMRLKVKEMTTEVCLQEMKGLKKKAGRWNGPDPIEICNLGSTSK
ncbi:E3 ubiquitin-protein ligase UBR3 [Rhynchospora pubera]|uniref:E3 ubiquitin-protein ligase UBR3 n=1 Tax=Rhynchospora pubera TaxID=906938 RepID=A0AAV8DAR9_9POAL|nr:E3 ubiquitin-protein ligase UBR3 [Rhynchospora pubera]